MDIRARVAIVGVAVSAIFGAAGVAAHADWRSGGCAGSACATASQHQRSGLSGDHSSYTTVVVEAPTAIGANAAEVYQSDGQYGQETLVRADAGGTAAVVDQFAPGFASGQETPSATVAGPGIAAGERYDQQFTSSICRDYVQVQGQPEQDIDCPTDIPQVPTVPYLDLPSVPVPNS